ncbi:MAG: type II toxin-antitoxin system VapC family toxin [Dehalococcoidia bacterium]
MIQAPDRLVPDASVAFKWLVTDEPDTAQAVAVLAAYAAGDLAFVAPDEFRYEVPAALRAATRRKPPRLTRAQAERAVAQFLALAIPTVTDDALAQRLGIPLLTADNKFYQHIGELPNVLWLADWPLTRSSLPTQSSQ